MIAALALGAALTGYYNIALGLDANDSLTTESRTIAIGRGEHTPAGRNDWAAIRGVYHGPLRHVSHYRLFLALKALNDTPGGEWCGDRRTWTVAKDIADLIPRPVGQAAVHRALCEALPRCPPPLPDREA